MRPERDYWNWKEYTIPYSSDWAKHARIEEFLRKTSYTKDGWEIRVTKEYPTPRKYGASKVVTCYHYYIRDDSTAAWVLLHT